MAFSLSDLFVSMILFVNSVAILNQERFLVKIGWTLHHSSQQAQTAYGGAPPDSMKMRIVHLIAAVRTLMRSAYNAQNEWQARRILVGLDVGEYKVGVAISDDAQSLAAPVGFLLRDSTRGGRLLPASLPLFQSLFLANPHVAGYVVGYPLELDGSFGAQAAKTLAFLTTLAQLYSVDFKAILLWDERFTSTLARSLKSEPGYFDAHYSIKKAIRKGGGGGRGGGAGGQGGRAGTFHRSKSGFSPTPIEETFIEDQYAASIILQEYLDRQKKFIL